MSIDLNDPRLTAYALGELDAAEAAEVDAVVRASSELQLAVEDIRATGEVLAAAFQQDAMPSLNDEQRAAISNPTASRNFGLTLLSLSVRPIVLVPASFAAVLLFAWMSLPTLSRSRGVASSSVSAIQNLRDLGYIGPGPSAREGRFESRAGGQESYAALRPNPFHDTLDQPLSTFSIDVDTASYANIRRFLNQERMPPPDAVRIEEMINYFEYDYPQPAIDRPFSVGIDVAKCPWHVDHLLARIGLQGYDVPFEERPAANLVFLIDVSGSMNAPDKLPLLKDAMAMLAGELHDDDVVSIVVYAGAAGLVLPATYGRDESKIVDAIDRLSAGGSTDGGSGIQLAYDIADEGFIEGGINRVMLATDGDFNVGITDGNELTRLIKEKAQTGIFLTVLGFGTGNLKDATLETLADKGNGHYAYIDSLNEAEKVLVDQVGGTLLTIAKDVKIQVEFNPATIAGYRLIGYENRMLAARDFNDDTKDAGEIGAGHSVTALYELVPLGVEVDPGDVNSNDVDPLKYQSTGETADVALDDGDAEDDQAPFAYADAHDDENAGAFGDEYMTVKLRYKEPDGDKSRLIRVAVPAMYERLDDASEDFRFAAGVASFGMLLRHSPYISEWTYDDTLELAETGIGQDPNGDRAEFLELVEKANALSATQPATDHQP